MGEGVWKRLYVQKVRKMLFFRCGGAGAGLAFSARLPIYNLI